MIFVCADQSGMRRKMDWNRPR